MWLLCGLEVSIRTYLIMTIAKLEAKLIWSCSVGWNLGQSIYARCKFPLNISTTASALVPKVQSPAQLSPSLPSGQQPSTYQTSPTQQQQNPQMATPSQVQQSLGICRVSTHPESEKWTTKLYILTIVFFSGVYTWDFTGNFDLGMHGYHLRVSRLYYAGTVWAYNIWKNLSKSQEQ